MGGGPGPGTLGQWVGGARGKVECMEGALGRITRACKLRCPGGTSWDEEGSWLLAASYGRMCALSHCFSRLPGTPATRRLRRWVCGRAPKSYVARMKDTMLLTAVGCSGFPARH